MEGMYTFQIVHSDSDIYHHGIKGQKWGVRRFQRKDGSLTPAGKKRLRDQSGADFDGDRVNSDAAKRINQKSGTLDRYTNEDGTLTSAGEERQRQEDGNRSLSYRVGEKRLNRRIGMMENRMAADLASVKRDRQDRVGSRSLIRSETEAALNTPSRVVDVGRRTIVGRTLAASGAAITSGGAILAAMSAEMSLPLVAIPASVIAAGTYWHKSKS